MFILWIEELYKQLHKLCYNSLRDSLNLRVYHDDLLTALRAKKNQTKEETNRFNQTI